MMHGTPGVQRIIAWAAVGTGLAVAYTVLWLGAWVTVPTLVTDLSPRVIASGSMGPRLDRGDIVLAGPAAPGDLEPGRAVVFEDPARPGRSLTHRIVGVNADGTLQTKGDANAAADSTAVEPDEVAGVVRLVVPAAGLPVVWARDGQAWLSANALGVVATALLGAYAGRRRLRLDPVRDDPVQGQLPPAPTGRPLALTAHGDYVPRHAAAGAAGWRLSGVTRRPPPRHAAAGGAVSTSSRRALPAPRAPIFWVVAAVVAMTASLVLPVDSLDAAFSGTASNASNSLTAASSFGCSSPGTVTALSVADSAVSEQAPDMNLGTDPTYFGVSSSDSGDGRALVSMELPPLPSGCAVTGVALRLYTRDGVTGRTLEAVRVDGPWTEQGVTWNNQPATTGTAATAPSEDLGWVEFGVTSIVEAMYAGSNHGFLVRDAVEGASSDPAQFMHPRENTNDPELVVTFGDPPTAPDAPGDLTATAVSSARIDLVWTDHSGNEDGFSVERSAGGAQSWSEIDVVGQDVTDYSDTTVAAETTYDYRVRAFNPVGESAYSGVASATTPVQSCTSPGTVTALSVADSLVSEQVPTTPLGTYAEYFGVRSLSSGNARSLVSMDLPAVPSGCVVTGATLRLYTSAGVTGRTLEAVRVDGSWTETGVTWSNQPGTTGTAATASSKASGWVEFGVTSIVEAMYAGSNHGFLLRDAVEEAASEQDQTMHPREDTNDPELVVTFGDPPTAPDAPSDLTATAVSSTQIDLAWTDNATNEDGFTIERSPGGADDWTVLGTNPADDATYSDTGLTSGVTYDYRVRADNTGGSSAPSNVASATTDVCSAPGTETVTADRDVFVAQEAPDTNFQNATYETALAVQSRDAGRNARLLVHFALPAVPSGCSVTGATLRLNATSADTGRTLQAHRAAAAWTEIDVTWNNQPDPVGTAATTTSGLGWREWAVTTQVQAMLTGANDGFIIRDSVESSATQYRQVFSSRETADPAELTVTFG